MKNELDKKEKHISINEALVDELLKEDAKSPVELPKDFEQDFLIQLDKMKKEEILPEEWNDSREEQESPHSPLHLGHEKNGHGDQKVPSKKAQIKPLFSLIALSAAVLLAVFFVPSLFSANSSGPMEKIAGGHGVENSQILNEGATEARDGLEMNKLPKSQMILNGSDGNGNLGEGEVISEGKLLSDSSPSDPSPLKQSDFVRKLIKNYEVVISVEHFDQVEDAIYAMVDGSGGYIENSNVDLVNAETGMKYGHYELRIPVDQSTGMYQQIKELGKVEHESSWVEDVTRQYSDIETKIKNYEATEKRYLELYDKAEIIQDILEIEAKINHVRENIELLKTRLLSYDNLVNFATIKLNVRQVKTIEKEIEVEPGLWGKAKEGFIDSMNGLIQWFQEFVVFIVSASPYLLIFLILLAVFYSIVVWRRKKSNHTK